MAHKKSQNISIVSGWIQKAEDDLSFAKDAFADTEYYDHICVLAQQAVEKYLKASIILGKGFLSKKERVHNLIYLSNLCKNYGLNLDRFEENLRRLSEAYIPARYPIGNLIKFTKKEAQMCLNHAKEIIGFIKRKINLSVYFK